MKYFIKILQYDDPYVVITVFKGENKRETLTHGRHITTTITQLRMYFDHLWPNAKVGRCNPGVRSFFDGEEEILKENS